MTTSARETGNLPTVGVRPAIEDDAGRIKCQVYSRAYIVGRGFVFTYCEGRQTWLVSWSVADRWRMRRQLRVCARHGAEFAATNQLAVDPPVEQIPPVEIFMGGAESTPSVMTAGAAHAAEAPTADPFNDPMPIGSDLDAPYARVRGEST